MKLDINHENMKAGIYEYVNKQISYHNAIISRSVSEIEYLENEILELRKKIMIEKDIIRKAKKEIEYYKLNY